MVVTDFHRITSSNTPKTELFGIYIYPSIRLYVCLSAYLYLLLPLGAQGIRETLRFTSVS
jgi:hypothetical protein